MSNAEAERLDAAYESAYIGYVNINAAALLAGLTEEQEELARRWWIDGYAYAQLGIAAESAHLLAVAEETRTHILECVKACMATGWVTRNGGEGVSEAIRALDLAAIVAGVGKEGGK